MADADSTLVIVARFLALLELFRESAIGFEQAEALGELTVRWTGPEDGDIEVDDEFDEPPPDADPGDERPQRHPHPRRAPMSDQPEPAEPTEAVEEQLAFDVADFPGGIHGALEAVLMVVDEPVTTMSLASVLEQPAADVEAALAELEAGYAEQHRGFTLRQVGGGWRMYSRHEYAPVVERFVLDGQQARLTQASLETLAVIAYRQPVSRSRVAAVRGVNVDGVIRTLLTRGLIEEMGHCWVGARLAYATSLPFPLLLLAAGAITCAIGTLVGLPALRLSGLYLALITLMFAGATTVALSAIDFPNGGGGFKGRSLTGELTTSTPPVRRPSRATADTAYYRYTVVVCALLFLFALLHVSGKPGRAWASIRESEPAALAVGVNITLYKLWAFALASFVTGVAGCLLAAQVGVPRAITSRHRTRSSCRDGADRRHLQPLGRGRRRHASSSSCRSSSRRSGACNSNLLLILFGVGLLQVLLTAPGGLASSSRRISRGSGGWSSTASASRPLGEAGAVIEVDGLTVRFAGVTPIDDISVVFPGGTCGLIGPNGAGKTTFFNVLSGFVRPAGGRSRVRRGPARDGRLQAGSLGAAADVPDGAGDRAALGVRQRGDDPRALGRQALLREPTCSARSLRRARSVTEGQGRRGSARRSGASWRSRAQSSASRASSCSTSRRPGFPTRRPSTSARSSRGSRRSSARSSSSSTTT